MIHGTTQTGSKTDLSLCVHYRQKFLWNTSSWGKPEVFNTPVSCLCLRLRCPWRSFMIETWKLLLFWHCSLPKTSTHTNEISMEIKKWSRAAELVSSLHFAMNGGEWHSHGADGGWLWVNKAQSAARLRRIVLWLALLTTGLIKGLHLPQRNVWTARETNHERERWGRELWRWLVMNRLLSGCWLCLGFSSCSTFPINSTTVCCTCQSGMCLE